MPVLKNSKHEAFAQALALGMPASHAYFEHVSGRKCSERTAEVNGSNLALSTEVALRISELRKKVGEEADRRFDLTKDKWLDRLERIATKAEDAEDFTAATGALDKIGKAGGYYAPDKVEHSGDEKLLAALAAIKNVTHG